MKIVNDITFSNNSNVILLSLGLLSLILVIAYFYIPNIKEGFGFIDGRWIVTDNSSRIIQMRVPCGGRYASTRWCKEVNGYVHDDELRIFKDPDEVPDLLKMTIIENEQLRSKNFIKTTGYYRPKDNFPWEITSYDKIYLSMTRKYSKMRLSKR